MIMDQSPADLGMSIFLTVSPLTSYLDQILAIKRRKNAAGFNIDVCAVMLTSRYDKFFGIYGFTDYVMLFSILRIFFWLGSRFRTALLTQSVVMIITQATLLRLALLYRPIKTTRQRYIDTISNRPFNFWRWQDTSNYWRFIQLLIVILCIGNLLLGSSKLYTSILGYLALGIEATLPIPQALSNYRRKSTEGFRASVLFAWLSGDITKNIYFFYGTKPVDIQFRLCSAIQTCFDIVIFTQFVRYYGNTAIKTKEKDLELAD